MRLTLKTPGLLQGNAGAGVHPDTLRICRWPQNFMMIVAAGEMNELTSHAASSVLQTSQLMNEFRCFRYRIANDDELAR